MYPYTIYNMETTGNLAEQFKSLGYSTTAMHPNHATNWNRENVYKDFGFDQFLSINDFQGADTLRGMVTDQATYDKILELLDQNADPQFVFDVTMQNHSGYDTGLLPADKQMHLNIDTTDLDAKTVEDGTLSDVDEYVSCIEQSDQALRYFLNALSKLDRKVVVVFWGDHQPFFPSKFNDKWFTGEDDATHQERLWQTDYIIWANYDVAGCDQTSETDDLSTNYLSTQLMQLIGAPLTDYQKAHMTLRESLPAINSVATRTPACVGRFPPTSPVTTPPQQPPPRRARITPRCSITRCSATARTCIPSTSRPRPTRPTPTWRRVRPRSSNGVGGPNRRQAEARERSAAQTVLRKTGATLSGPLCVRNSRQTFPAPPPAAAPHPLRVEWADEKLRSPRSRSVAWHAHRGKLVPEFTSGMGCGFRLWPRWETASHSDHKFRVTFSAKASTGNRVPFLSRILGCIFR